MSEAPYVPFYTSDFLGGTSGMTAATKGVYITLLCLMYEVEGPLTQTHGSLARRCGASNSGFQRALDELLADGKITITEAGIWSEKCEKHISNRANRVARTSKAASVRWEKHKQKQGLPDASALPKQCYPEPEPEPYKIEEPNGSSVVSPLDRSAECIAHFNATARQVGWPEVQKFTPARRAALSQRIKDVGGVDGWMEAITRASNSPLLTGQTSRGWRADFDWLCKAANFTKLMEGNYDPSTHASTHARPNTGSGRSGLVDGFAAVAARYASKPSGS